MKDRSHDEAMSELFQSDQGFAAAYLDSLLEEGDQADLLIALRQMSKPFGGMSILAEKANLNQTQLYRILSEKGNPVLSNLIALLKVMGLRLGVQPVTEKAAHA